MGIPGRDKTGVSRGLWLRENPKIHPECSGRIPCGISATDKQEICNNKKDGKGKAVGIHPALFLVPMNSG